MASQRPNTLLTNPSIRYSKHHQCPARSSFHHRQSSHHHPHYLHFHSNSTNTPTVSKLYRRSKFKSAAYSHLARNTPCPLCILRYYCLVLPLLPNFPPFPRGIPAVARLGREISDKDKYGDGMGGGLISVLATSMSMHSTGEIWLRSRMLGFAYRLNHLIHIGGS